MSLSTFIQPIDDFVGTLSADYSAGQGRLSVSWGGGSSKPLTSLAAHRIYRVTLLVSDGNVDTNSETIYSIFDCAGITLVSDTQAVLTDVTPTPTYSDVSLIPFGSPVRIRDNAINYVELAAAINALESA